MLTVSFCKSIAEQGAADIPGADVPFPASSPHLPLYQACPTESGTTKMQQKDRVLC